MSSMAVVKFTNYDNEHQQIYYRYCDVTPYTESGVCIIESKPNMKRFVMKAQLGSETLNLFVDDWFNGKLKEYLREELILEEKTGSVFVKSIYLEFEYQDSRYTDEFISRCR